jgi:hypothetical protein
VTSSSAPYHLCAALGAATFALAVAGPEPASASVCSVLSRHPCAPTYCSPFQRHPCFPFYDFPLGENLQLTINTKEDTDRHSDAPGGVDTIRAMFAALRACWQPPPQEKAREGMQISVRLSFTRDGKLKGEPRFTYVSPGAASEARETYQQAIKDALDRCTPMQFTNGMGGAIAGRPIAIRFVENRTAKASEEHP